MQKIIDEVCDLFVPMVCHEWISWGRDLLFLELAEQVQRKEQEAVAARAKAEVEAAEAKLCEEVEEAKQQAAVVKAAKIEG